MLASVVRCTAATTFKEKALLVLHGRQGGARQQQQKQKQSSIQWWWSSIQDEEVKRQAQSRLKNSNSSSLVALVAVQKASFVRGKYFFQPLCVSVCFVSTSALRGLTRLASKWDAAAAAMLAIVRALTSERPRRKVCGKLKKSCTIKFASNRKQ